MKKFSSYLICYDISNPARLGKVHRIVREYTLMVQYSVYYLYADQQMLDSLCDELTSCIDPEADDVRIYPLASKPEWSQIGQNVFPEGVHLLDEGAAAYLAHMHRQHLSE
jgi:CRISPR-associated protein Cas2